MTLAQLIIPVLQISILMTVFGVGLRATFGDVLYLVRRPSLFGRSLIAMFVIMPAFALTLDKLFEFHSAVEIILIALSITPIPPLLPTKAEKAGSQSSYGLGLMAVVGILSIVLVPAALALLSRYFTRPLDISPLVIGRIVFMSVVLPLAAGIAFHATFPALARRIAEPIGKIGLSLLLLGVLVLLAGVMPSMIELIGNGTLVAFALFAVTGIAVGHWLGGPDNDDRLVLALSTATRHPAIALAVAKANFPDEPLLTASVLLYLVVNAVVGVPFQMWRKGKSR